LVENMLNKDELDDFLTSVCYPHIVTTAYDDGRIAKL
jgi:malate synthase